jgi:protein ImuB
LGAEGARLVAEARALPPGALDDPLLPTPKPTTIDETAELEYAVESLEPLSFVLRGLIDRVVARARVRSMACGSFELVMALEPSGLGPGAGREDRRQVVVAAPTRDLGTLLMLARASIEKRPPEGGVKEIQLRASAQAIRARQLSFFAPAGPAPERLASTLARLQAMLGPARVGTPRVTDTHRVGAFDLTALATEDEASWTFGGAKREDRPGKPEAAPLAVHVLRPPRKAEVFFERERMTYVRADGLGGRVIEHGGPWRVTADWWTAERYGRDYYDVELGDGGIYRLYREHASGDWFVDGRYD